MLGIGQSETELARQILIKKGVPEAAIGVLGNQVTSAWDEPMAVRDWANRNPTVKRLIIVTDLFHTRRCRWLFRKQLHAMGTRIQVAGIQNPDYSTANWWCHENGLLSFQNEMVKYPYYWVKY